MQRPDFPRRLLAAHLLGLSGLLALPAQATIITNSLTATASAQAASNSPTVEGPQTDSSYVSQYVYSYATPSDASASAWGNEYGVYRASAEGRGQFNSQGHFQRALTLSNNNGYATDYSVSFFIYYGSMSADNYGVSGSGWGSFDLNITRRGANALFASYAKIDSNGELTRTGTELNGATLSGSQYYWDGTYVNLDLGTLANGESLTIDFDLVSTAFGNFGFNNDSCYEGYGGYGGQVQAMSMFEGYGGYVCTGQVYASLGDPSDFSENGFNNPFAIVTEQRTPSNDVPLPGTLALLGLGVGGLGLMRARRSG
jgi:hypothetical protein